MDNAEFSTPNVHRNNKNGNLNGKKSEILY